MYGKTRNKVAVVSGNVDSDFTGDQVKRKSITGYLFVLNNCLIS